MIHYLHFQWPKTNILLWPLTYIEQARKIIAIVKQLDDFTLAKALEIELNNLMTRADYYFESSKFPTVTSRS